MRYKSRNNRFAKRTLDAFYTTMMDQISNRSFETIQVRELCEQANYPRATFYNYFKDKYDLLEYCWSRIREEIMADDYDKVPSKDILYVLFGRLYNFFSSHEDRLLKVLSNNPSQKELFLSFQSYVRKQILEILLNIDFPAFSDVPCSILAEHYTNTLLLVLNHAFLKGESIDKTEAFRILTSLLSSTRKYHE